jgi:predicted ATPase
MRLATDQGIPYCVGYGTALRGCALAEKGKEEEGVAQVCRGMAVWQDTETEIGWTYFLALLAEAYGKAGQADKGLAALADAPALVDKTGDRRWEAEVYRLKGQLTLQKWLVLSGQFSGTDPCSLLPDPQGEAEACFLKAIEVARRQSAKSLELRATVCLARLWRQQGKTTEAHQLLFEVYHWFTEGFDTKDLQEAKALLDELS